MIDHRFTPGPVHLLRFDHGADLIGQLTGVAPVREPDSATGLSLWEPPE